MIHTQFEPFYECPKFDSCSVNDCPLAYGNYISLPDDPETECKMRYAERKKIAEKYNLPNMGMTKKELAKYHRSQKRKLWWKNLPEEKKRKYRSNLK